MSGSSARWTGTWVQQIAALGIKGIYQRKEYKRQYPEGEAGACGGFTNVEDKGQEGMELAFNEPAGRQARRAASSRTAWAAWSRTWARSSPVDGRDMQLSIDSKVQFFAYQKLRDAVTAHKAKAGSVVVLDAVTARCWRWPTTPATPDKTPEPDRRAAAQPRADRHLRARLDHEALHHWRWRWKPARQTPPWSIDTTPGRLTITGRPSRHAPAWRAHRRA